MQELVQTVFSGVAAGSLDALLALGIVLIYRTTGVLNFAQAATGTFAAYATYSVAQSHPLWLATGAGLLAAAALGGASYWAISGIRSAHFALVTAVATLALSILVQQLISLIWGPALGVFPNPFSPDAVSIGSVSLPAFQQQATEIGVAAFLALGLGAFLRWTRLGTMLRALADNQEAARLCGGNVPLLLTGMWAAAGALSGIAAFFAAEIVFFPSFMDPLFLFSLIAAVLGGLRSLVGTFCSALSLEVAHNLFIAYAPAAVTPYTQTLLVVLLIAVLLVVPWSRTSPGTQRVV
jgi:branched-chain amino acid transport system permease protein